MRLYMVLLPTLKMYKVGASQVRLDKTVDMYSPYTAIYLVISLPRITYIHRIYVVLANPILWHTCTI